MLSIPRSLIHPIQTHRSRLMVAQLDEFDPVERAFQALVIEHRQNVPSAPRKTQTKGGAA